MTWPVCTNINLSMAFRMFRSLNIFALVQVTGEIKTKATGNVLLKFYSRACRWNFTAKSRITANVSKNDFGNYSTAVRIEMHQFVD